MAVNIKQLEAEFDELFARETPESFMKWKRRQGLLKRAQVYNMLARDKDDMIKELARQLNEGYKFMITK